MNLSKNHIDIMNHTDLNQVYCGDDPELKELCEAGLIERLGYKVFVPDPYYRLTDKGREEVYQLRIKTS